MRDLISELPEAVISAPAWWVALSGGADSVALLHALSELRNTQGGPPIRAIHVNHGLHPDAIEWAAACQRHCDTLGVPLRVETCHIVESGKGLEADARRARYAVFESVLAAREVLFTAHHVDDMVETVLLRLFRGAGPRGLAGIPRQRTCGEGLIFRPLLDVSGEALKQAVESAGLSYVVDPSNLEIKQDRNYIRQVILPAVAERWPGYRETIRRAASLQNMAHEQLVATPLPQTRTAVGESALAIDTSIDAPRLAAQIYQWLASDEAPDRRRLLEFARQALDARADRIPELKWSGECLRVWAGMVIRVIEPDTGEAWPQQLVVGEPHHGPWGTYDWEVSDRPDHGLPAGLPLEVVPAFSVPELKLPNRPRKAIGKCLQEFRIPPWWRRYLPVLYYKNDAVWAVNIGPLAGWESQAKQTGGATFLPVWGPRGTL